MSNSLCAHSFTGCLEVLRQRLQEPVRLLQLLSGPRQIGKTTLLRQLCAERGAAHAAYVAADATATSLPGFWQRLWQRCGEQARRKAGFLLAIDEIQYLESWSAQLKSHWDALRLAHVELHVVATGSAALALAPGSRESLAGRFERLSLTHWSASSLAQAFDLEPAAASQLVVCQGGYPGSMPLRHDFNRWAAYIRDAIIEPAIGRDILALGRVRRPALLRQLFATATAAPAQIISFQKIQGQLQEAGAVSTLTEYLALLTEAHLVVGLSKYTARALRQRNAPPKLLVLNNALLSAMCGKTLAAIRADTARWGAWVENACLAFAYNSGQNVQYWRQEPYEVDAVLQGSWGDWAIEVKTGRFSQTDLQGLAAFTTQHPQFQPLVLCEPRHVKLALQAGIAALPWPDYLAGSPLTQAQQP